MIYAQLRVKLRDEEFAAFVRHLQAWRADAPQALAMLTVEDTSLDRVELEARLDAALPDLPHRAVLDRWVEP
jgi:hypothetical protein